MVNHKVQYRGGFADRNGKSIINKEIQYEDLDSRTRNSLLNAFNEIYMGFKENSSRDNQYDLLMSIQADVYCEVVTKCLYVYDQELIVMNLVSNTILHDNYYDIFSLLEYVVMYFKENEDKDIEKLFNEIFIREYVGYRFINGLIVPITNEIEKGIIEDTINNTEDRINTHINKAITLLSDRNSPDYENSVKESIMAVEASCNLINGKDSSLGDALKNLENNGVVIHPALKEAFNKLYGYTSDATGIRHAGIIFDNKTTFAEAKFMLVACCAFINYLKENE